MKILMLTPYLPYPPASGGQIRTYNLLKYLSKKNDITLISLYKNEKAKEDAAHLRSYCKRIFLCKRPENPWQVGNILKSAFSFIPFLIVRNFSQEAKEIIEKLLKEESFDVIHAETFYIMPHIPKTDIPILLVEQTIEYKVYQHFISTLPFWVQIPFNIDIIKLKFWEIYYWKKATMVSSVSDYDKQTIKKQTPEIEPVIIPNGAGDEMFATSLKKKNVDKPMILFVGNFFWLQNVEAAHYLIDKLFPKLKPVLKDAVFVIAGQNAKNKIKYQGDKNIKIIDIAQNDVNSVKKLYDEASLFVAPIFGPGGTRLKILAAMASGLPVVTTKIGVEGLSVEDKVHAYIADGTNDFVKQIQIILSDNDIYERLRKKAYELAKEKFSWEKITGRLEAAYKTITK